MKVTSIIFCLMFLTSCSGASTVLTTAAKVQPQLVKNKNWLPTHHITSQDFVFKDGKVCTINSLADAYCTAPNTNFSFRNDTNSKQLANKASDNQLSLGKEDSSQRLNYLMKLEENTSLEYSFGRHALTVAATHKF